MQKLGFYLPLRETLVFCAPLLDLAVSFRDNFGKFNVPKLLLLHWVFVSMLLSNIYRGIVVENIVIPRDFQYPVTFDDLKTHSFQIFAIESFDHSTFVESAFYEHVSSCFFIDDKCPPVGNLSDKDIYEKYQSLLETLRKSSLAERQAKRVLSKFERRLLDVYSENEIIHSLYEDFMMNKLTFEQAETEGQKLVSEYLYRRTQSIEPKNLNAVFYETMTCNRTAFTGFVEHLAEIKRRLPTRSVKTGHKFYVSETHGYEHNIRYIVPTTGSASSDEKVPRNFKAVFESGIFNAWQDFILCLSYMNLRVRTKREYVAMKLESGILSLFLSFFVFAGLLSIILLLEHIKSVFQIIFRRLL